MTLPGADLRLAEFQPRLRLARQEHRIEVPGFPFIDAHNHLAADFGGGWDGRPVQELLARLDQVHVRAYVDLDGCWGGHSRCRLRKFKDLYPQRFPSDLW